MYMYTCTYVYYCTCTLYMDVHVCLFMQNHIQKTALSGKRYSWEHWNIIDIHTCTCMCPKAWNLNSTSNDCVYTCACIQKYVLYCACVACRRDCNKTVSNHSHNYAHTTLDQFVGLGRISYSLFSQNKRITLLNLPIMLLKLPIIPSIMLSKL